MLQAPPARSPHKRGHSHKRSAAISGDFDLEFFKGPSIAQALGPKRVEVQPPITPQTAPRAIFASNTTPTFKPPQIVVTQEHVQATRTPSPKKSHTRINSWAHTLSSTTNPPGARSDYNSSTETTPESKIAALNYSYGATPQKYEIPEAIIDLDLAAGVFYDPATNTHNPKIQHRRTESAPELEDFFKSSVLSAKGSRRNSAIYEEDEEDGDEDDVLSATSSTRSASGPLNKNSSTNSLNSTSSAGKYTSALSTPTSAKALRGGATAARYQSYYNNSILLSNALKSSESLTRITGDGQSSMHKPSYSSLHRTPLSHAYASSASSTSNASVINSPSRFKFESRVYDMPSASESSTSLSLDQPKDKSSPSPRKVISKGISNAKSHKKSKSLLNSISQKIFSSPSKVTLNDDTHDDTVVLNDEDDDEANTTLTQLNFGEPGPALDLTTMTTKYNYELDDTTCTSAFQPEVKVEKKRKNGFFNWRKK